jgi:hypothetical protein
LILHYGKHQSLDSEKQLKRKPLDRLNTCKFCLIVY